MTVIKFIRVNLDDAERRLARLTEPVPDDEPSLWRIADDSVLGGLSTWIGHRCGRARFTSRFSAMWSDAAHTWVSITPLVRIRLTGAVFVVAVGVHLALLAPMRPLGGWWLILPGIAMTIGSVAVGLSWPGRRQ